MKPILKSHSKIMFSGLFFFFVLFSLFVMRPFRGVITAQIGTADLTYFLFIVVLVMLIVNFIYSAIVSRIRESKLVIYVYGFFILNLLIFSNLNYIFPESYFLSGSFYIWYNVFNFSVVSVFADMKEAVFFALRRHFFFNSDYNEVLKFVIFRYCISRYKCCGPNKTNFMDFGQKLRSF